MEIADKPMREKIAEKIWEHEVGRWAGYNREDYADAILAIPEIKEGQELREKAKSGKLVELAETAANLDGVQPPNYSECLKIADRLGTSLANVAAIYGEIQKDSSLKRVRPLASGESR